MEGRRWAVLYERLAELYRLPSHVRRLLVGMGANPQFLEWAAPVENAILELDGSSHTNLISFHETAGLTKAMHNLPLCAALLGGRDALEIEQLSEIRDAIQSTLDAVASADDINPDLADWLESVLLEAERAVQDALIVGVYAARGRVRAIIGRIPLDPHPSAENKSEEAAIKSVGKIVLNLAKVLHAGRDIYEFLKPGVIKFLGE